MNVRIRPLAFSDRRNGRQLEQARALEQERADKALEAEWRRRVAENVRRRLAAKVDKIAAELAA